MVNTKSINAGFARVKGFEPIPICLRGGCVARLAIRYRLSPRCFVVMAAGKSKRSLRFESLETRTSLTAPAPGFELFDDRVVELADAESQADHDILHYLSGLSEISLERSVPTEREVIAADQWLAAESPEEFHGTHHDEY